MIFQMSAVLGQDWRPKTYKELLIQWEASLLESWSHTASIQAAFAGKKTKFEDLHPYLSQKTSGSSTRIKLQPKKMFRFQSYRGGERVSILDQLRRKADG